MQAQSVPTKVFRVDEFRNPVLPEERRRVLEAAESRPLDMSVAGVLQAAQARTGLDDFGPLDFKDRLSRLLGEVEADTNVWKASKTQFVEACVNAAANRLRNREFLKRHPQAHDIVVDRPIFIVGLPRSGTTHLENLIASDRRLRYLPVYLGAQAAPTPGEVPGPDGRDPRWHRSNLRWERVRANPIMAAMHEHSPDHACGENELQIPDFASYQWEWLADVPKWRDFYYTEDQTPHYEYARAMLKAIAFQQPNERRWILKGNAQSEQLPALMKVYPDATIVMTHRDPLAILQSVLTMRGLSVLNSQKIPDIAAHVTYWVDRIERMLHAYMNDMDVVPAGRRMDLLFQDVMADDVSTAQRVLTAAGLSATPESVQDMREYMEHHPRGRDGRVVYDLAGNFKLDLNVLRNRFRFYTDRFAVRHEVK
jgi:sulfotransferase family protein